MMNRLRKSRWLGVLYFLVSSQDPEIREQISEDHRRWILDELAKVNIDTFATVFSIAESIEKNPRVRGSLEYYLERELRTYRTPKTVNVPEPRRIGVGYRDKGSLRPSHKRGRDHGVEVFWSEDVPILFPENFQPRFITAEEVSSLGTNLEHLRIWKQTLTYNREAPTLLSDSH